jgi:hypothetical protein
MKKQFNLQNDLFRGTYPTCYVYADSTREKAGMYHEIGRIYFSPLRIETKDHSPEYAGAHEAMRADYKKLLSVDSVQVSATGQTTAVTHPKA